MSSDAPESAQQDSSELFYSAILLVCAWTIACDTKLRVVNRNQADAELPDCALLIVASSHLRIVLQSILSTLEGMLLSATTRLDTVHVLMGFIGLSVMPTIYSNTGSYSE